MSKRLGEQDDNLYDVLELVMGVMTEEPAALVPAFERKAAVQVVFKLLASPNQLLRLPALKLLAHFLSRSTAKSPLPLPSAPPANSLY